MSVRRCAQCGGKLIKEKTVKSVPKDRKSICHERPHLHKLTKLPTSPIMCYCRGQRLEDGSQRAEVREQKTEREKYLTGRRLYGIYSE